LPEQRAGKVVHVLEQIAEPAEQGQTHDRQQEELAEGHHDAGDRKNAEGDGVGPVRRTLEGRETLNLAAGFGTMQLDAALADIKQRDRADHNQQQGAAIGNQPVVADLPPGFTGIGQPRARVLHKGLDQVAGFGRLAFGQAAVAGETRADLAP
jgi:hypothetical protein